MATSTISNVIKDPSGTAITGVLVTATLMPTAGFRISDASEVARTVSATTDGTGTWSLALEQTANITPSNTYYEVVEMIPAASGGTRVWTIQVGAGSSTVSAALVTPLPAAQASGFLTQAAADARYQALGSLGSSTPTQDSQTAGAAGVSSSASRADHQHWQADATPRGTLGYAKATTNQGSITTAVDLTSLSVTVSVAAGRRIRITGSTYPSSTVATDRVTMSILEGATQLQEASAVPASSAISCERSVVLSPGAGSHTYKLQMARTAGTGTVTNNASATFPAYLLVEDIGT